VEAVYHYLLPRPRIRFLLAADIGAGKTIMAGLLIKEFLFSGDAGTGDRAITGARNCFFFLPPQGGGASSGPPRR